MTRFRFAAQPINWINDDFRDLGADITLQQALTEMRQAGFTGTELGHRFPDRGGDIKALLDRHGLALAAGWHSTFCAGGARSWSDEVEAFDRHCDRLQQAGAEVVILAECTGAIHGDGRQALSFRDQRTSLGAPPTPERDPLSHLGGGYRGTMYGAGTSLLDDDDPRAPYASRWRAMCDGLDRLAQRAAARGMKSAYHPHMGTVVQTARDIDALMADTQHLGLLLDTGHITFAGDDPRTVLMKHGARVAHVHLKDVRATVAADAKARGASFEAAVRAGVFTVPGDGCVDMASVCAELSRSGYAGWVVVEAEQDPRRANPLAYALLGRRTLARLL